MGFVLLGVGMGIVKKGIPVVGTESPVASFALLSWVPGRTSLCVVGSLGMVIPFESVLLLVGCSLFVILVSFLPRMLHIPHL